MEIYTKYLHLLTLCYIMAIPKLYYILCSVALRGNDSVKGLTTASNDGLYFII